MSIKSFYIFIFTSLIFSCSLMQTVSAAEIIDFSLKDFQGNTHTVKQYRGKWIVVNYWGIFCGPCLREMPELSIFHNEHKDHDAVVLGINQEDLPVDVLTRFANKMKIDFPLLNVPFDQETPFGQVTVLPTTFIINPKGELVAGQKGPITGKALEDFIRLKTAEAPKGNVTAK